MARRRWVRSGQAGLGLETLTVMPGGKHGRSVYVGSNVLAVRSRLGVDGVHDKGRAVQVRLGQPAAYLEFLADGDGPQRAPDEQFDDASRCPSAQRPEFQHRTEVDSGAAAEQVAQFLLGVFDPPAIEIGGLLVVGIQDGGEQGRVGGVAEVLQKASGEDNIHSRAFCSSERSGIMPTASGVPSSAALFSSVCRQA